MTGSAETRLLVVEDEEHLAAGLKLNLELEGYRVDVAGNAREAGERLLKPDAYAAIVLDVMLPDVDGFELCRRLREAGKLGFRQAVVPQSQQISDDVRGAGVTIRPCADVSGLVAAIARMSPRERTVARG